MFNMKTIKNIIYLVGLTGLFSLTVFGCKENSLVFPDQIESNGEDTSEDRGPVKQGNFSVIVENDETVKFDLSSVDRERVSTILFSYNRNGDVSITEVSDFDELYVISNLSLEQFTDVDVWAKGLDGLESKKFIYKVKPSPFPAKIIAKTVSLRTQGFSGILNITNTTPLNSKLYYKLDGASVYSSFDVPLASVSKDLVFPDKLTVGSHTVEYYVEDENGNLSIPVVLSFTIDEPTIELFTTTDQKSSWTPWALNGYPAGFAANRAIDGVIGNMNDYQFVTASDASLNKFKISFTKNRVASDPNFNTSVTENPNGEHNLLVVKSVTLYSGSQSWGINPSIAHVYGYKEDGTVVDFGIFSNPTPVTLTNPFIIDLSSNSSPLKAIQFNIVNSRTSPTVTGYNLNEINLSGYYY